jgi:inactivated superfamily I helicase/RecB family exonuclease
VAQAFTIPLGTPFIPALAAWLTRSWPQAEALAAVTVWLPNQRARAALVRALAGQGVALLPSLRLLRAEEPDVAAPAPNTLGPSQLRALLTGLLARDNPAAAALAAPLARLHQNLAQLADPNWDDAHPLHTHLKTLLQKLDAVLVQHHLTTLAAAARESLAAAQTLPGPQVAAGFLEAYGSGADLLRTVAARPDGTLIFPDLPHHPAPSLAGHPGAALAELLAALAIPPAGLQPLPGVAPPPSAAMPQLIEAPTPQAEAAAIRVAARHAVAEGRTPLLILCPDDTLRGLIAAELHTHGLAAAAGGLPIAHTPAGHRLSAVARSAADPTATTLAALTASLGFSPWLDAALWRGLAAETWPGWAAKLAALDLETLPLNHRPQTEKHFHAFRAALEPLAAPRPLFRWVTDTLSALTALAPDWPTQPGARTLRRWLAQLARLPLPQPWPAQLWADFLATELDTLCLPAAAETPILLTGLIESRLLNAQTVILAGATEGAWPATAPDALLTENDCARLGLPGPRRRLRLTAAEWALATRAAPTVLISRSLSDGKDPTQPSRFLLTTATGKNTDYLAWAQPPQGPAQPRPHPGSFTLPPSLWPQSWSASWVEGLVRCPYQTVAERRLHLQPLSPYLADPTAESRGLWVHRWLADFHRQGVPSLTPATRAAAIALLEQLGQAELVRQPTAIARLWQPRLAKLAAALVDAWLEDAAQGRAFGPVENRLEWAQGDVTLNARADRLDTSPAGTWVVDYKTGQPPQWAEVRRGDKPQLLLESWLLRQAGQPVGGVEYLQVKGYGPQPVRRQSRVWADIAATVETLGPWLTALAQRYAPGHAFPANPVWGGGLKPRGYCERCAFGGVCRWNEAAPPAPEQPA